MDDAVAERLRTERVLADRLQYAAERRFDDAQHHEEEDRDAGEDEVVGKRPAGDRDVEGPVLDQLENSKKKGIKGWFS